MSIQLTKKIISGTTCYEYSKESVAEINRVMQENGYKTVTDAINHIERVNSMKIQEKFSYDVEKIGVTQQAALNLAKKRVKELVSDPKADLEEGLFIVHAARERSYYVENTCPLIRYNLGEEIVWSLD